ncbi:DNA-binding MarR family transcriptional regulator [Diaminobutyricimonas aerilata]|uniref:DNA-binding MarR family transcriptional regulator n=1 Tax=Diaminobutyricimonas aerilata TaxID=1162967 RepID=A0A2M9CNQ8_9MICO|nr:MarR family transcriptional regulator [Diaminobutyricimonas aerilata]PJJ73519.1 DNA-binding MarR family transcriptional regulator [Diaminobutyricimonas aerilata]
MTTIRPDTPATQDSGYWYADAARTRRGIEVLNALRQYRAAESEMRRRTRTSMGMGETDILAIRYLLQAEKLGLQVSPKDLAAKLQISSASVTVLIDRLVKSGHVERQPHPTDRRAIIVAPTHHTNTEVRGTLGQMHERMIDVAESLEPDEAAAVVRFLARMREAVDEIDAPHER